jgi:hypothetical protein
MGYIPHSFHPSFFHSSSSSLTLFSYSLLPASFLLLPSHYLIISSSSHHDISTSSPSPISSHHSPIISSYPLLPIISYSHHGILSSHHFILRSYHLTYLGKLDSYFSLCEWRLFGWGVIDTVELSYLKIVIDILCV